MTNTGTTVNLSNFDKVKALVEVEEVGFYTGGVTDAVQAGIDEGFLAVFKYSDEQVVRLTDVGRARLAGFRALLAPLD